MNIVAFLLDAAFKSSILVSIAFLLTIALRRHSASLRHLVWSAAIIASVVLPLLTIAIPSVEVSALEPVAAFLSPGSQVSTIVDGRDSMSVNAASSSARSFSPTALLLPLLAGGIVVGFLLLAGASLRLTWIASRAEPFFDSRWLFQSVELSRRLRLRRAIRFLQHRGASMLVTWGMFSPRVLLPSDVEQWPDHRVRAVLGHELAHVSRGDWLVQLFAEAARVLYWFNPLIWFACSRIKEESERACDDAVLNLGVDETEYATNLLAVARALKHSHRTWSPALGIARPSNLERRFAAMLNRKLDRRSATPKAVLLTALATLAIMLPLSALRSPAQVFGGKFAGTITDTTGAPVPNATVIVSNAQAGIRFMTTTSATGRFEFASIPTGPFLVETISQGFARPASSITFQPNQNIRQDLQMTKITGPPSIQLTPAEQATLAAPRLGSPPSLPPPAPRLRANERLNGVVGGLGPGATRVGAPPPPPPSRIRVGGNVAKARLIHQVTAIYPPEAKAAGIEGNVFLEAVIDNQGKVIALKVIGNPSPELAQAAVEAVSQWLYQPTLLNGVPVVVVTTVTVNFKIGDEVR